MQSHTQRSFISLLALGVLFVVAQGCASQSLADQYRVISYRIIESTLEENDGYQKMQELCDGIGHRLSGSSQLTQAINWAADAMRADGQDNVRIEPVMVPHWVRGNESLLMTKPRVAPVVMLGLGRSVGTPEEGITAEVVVVSDEKELEELGNGAKGKIVLFNNPMPAYDPQRGAGYGTTVRFRSRGATLAAAQGAVACLVRSVTAHSLRSPHTGAMNYGDAKVKIPAAAISTEDAAMLARLQSRGVPIEVTLKMQAKTLEDAQSGNVIGEIRGSERPEEIIVIGGHIDSWDVGQGAHDDGTGCVMAMEAINVLRKLNLRPRRTIRVVLWTNEENGLAGAKQYAADHKAELRNHVAAIESDSGGYKPLGYSFECSDEAKLKIAEKQLRDIAKLLKPMGAGRITVGGSGADVGPMRDAGVVLMGHRVEGKIYFDYHHTHADTLDKVDPQEFSQNIAVMATMAYILADMPNRLGEETSK
ncbi:MAG: M20/M25/M40 family metallo-hydrolase [Planctomycetes bacterium]|nr:M20/M25/M40 family metallo-hydrolase [Planctomycetota bacterium]